MKDYVQTRYWRSTHIALLKQLAAYNKKNRPIESPMSLIEYLDEVAHSVIS